jgi:thiamine transporter ThiT
MDWINSVKGWIGELTEIALMLLALAIVLSMLVSPTLPFFGDVAKNIMAFVKGLGDGGLIGLITLGFILWLFSKRQVA